MIYAERTKKRNDRPAKEMEQQPAKKVKRTNMVKEIQENTSLLSRTSTVALVKAIQDFTPRQRQAVVDLGFKTILQLKITYFPSKLAYWIVENFDYRDSTISLKKNRSIEINKEDIYRIFDFPRGKEPIEKRRWENEKNDTLEEWYNCFNNRNKIVPQMIAAKMLETDGGDMFKRHFMVLMHASLIDMNLDGYIHPYIMHHFEDVDRVKNLDWGEYVMKCLEDRITSWESRKKASFGGPTLLLIVRYN